MGWIACSNWFLPCTTAIEIWLTRFAFCDLSGLRLLKTFRLYCSSFLTHCVPKSGWHLETKWRMLLNKWEMQEQWRRTHVIFMAGLCMFPIIDATEILILAHRTRVSSGRCNATQCSIETCRVQPCFRHSRKRISFRPKFDNSTKATQRCKIIEIPGLSQTVAGPEKY